MTAMLAYLACMTATFLGGFSRVGRVPSDDILYVIFLTPLIILLPWIVFVITRRWQKIHTSDRPQDWTRFFKCATLMILGSGLALVLKAAPAIMHHQFNRALPFDPEFPAAGIMYLFGALCCLEYLRDYKMEPYWVWALKTTQQRLSYLGTSVTVIVATASLIGFLFAIGAIH